MRELARSLPQARGCSPLVASPSISPRRTRANRQRSAILRFALVATMSSVLFPATADAQVTAWSDQNQHRKGQLVSPVYEGWYKGPDGVTLVSFGYQNMNTEEVLDIPIGPNNRIEPGPPDQGQPTHFFTGKHYGVFAVAVPKDKPTTEVTWTLTVNGQTTSIPANLSPLYIIEALKTLGTSNEPPILKFAADGPTAMGPGGMITTSLETTVSKPLTLDVWVSDDTIPPTPKRRAPNPAAQQPTGLSVTWTKFRGVGPVQFSNDSPPIERGKASTTVVFSQAGDYALRVLASDGSGFGNQCCWTNGYVKIKVRPAASSDR
jgi:hypothetical protein